MTSSARPRSYKMQRTLLVIRFSAASTTPSLARMPTQDPALEIASMAYLQAGRNTAGPQRAG